MPVALDAEHVRRPVVGDEDVLVAADHRIAEVDDEAVLFRVAPERVGPGIDGKPRAGARPLDDLELPDHGLRLRGHQLGAGVVGRRRLARGHVALDVLRLALIGHWGTHCLSVII